MRPFLIFFTIQKPNKMAAKVRFSNGRTSLDRFIKIKEKKRNHLNTESQNVRNSNGFGIRMFGIRAPTVSGVVQNTTIYITAKFCYTIKPNLVPCCFYLGFHEPMTGFKGH